MASIEGVWAKFHRAEAHADAFDALLTRYVEGDSYAVAFEFDPKTGWHHFRWNVRVEPPRAEFSLIFGDMLYNLRACLDHLVWQLVLANGEDPSLIKTSFPAAQTPHQWASAQGEIQGVADPWKAEIDHLQPYHRPDRPEIHLLAILDEVNNLHKHRFVAPTLAGVEGWRTLIDVRNVPDGEQLEQFFDPAMRHAADFFRIRTASRIQLEMEMQSKPSLRISFGGGPPDFDWTNRGLINWVFNALARFTPAFGS